MFDRLKGTRPVLFFSGGLDSTLLLAMLREQEHDFDIFQYREFLTKAQKKRSDELIKQWNLKVFCWPAASINLIGEGDKLSTVFEIAISGGRIPIIRDVIEGDRCIADFEGGRMEYPPMEWDLALIGSRKEDTHYSLEDVVPGEEWKAGNTTFWAPLYNLKRSDVIRELEARGLDGTEISDEEDSGSQHLCTKCLQGKAVFCPMEQAVIPPVSFDRGANLRLFRQSYA